MRILLILFLIQLFSIRVLSQLSLGGFALTHVTIIDANHKIPARNETVVIEGGKITAVFPDGTRPLPESFIELNFHGKFLVPGLIDTHVHLATDPSETDDRASTIKTLNKMLFSGITSVRDMAGDARILAGLSRDALTGEMVSPNIYFSALMAGPEFFSDERTFETTRGGRPGKMPYMLAVTDSTNFALAVAEAKGTGASGIKLYADLNASVIQKIVSEANRQHMKVWGHAWLQQARPSDLVKAGVSSISHAFLMLYELKDSVPASWKLPVQRPNFWNDSLPDYSALFTLMKSHNTILDATIAVYRKWSLEDSGKRSMYAIEKRLTAAAYKAGVKICAGTDDNQAKFVQNEMQLLVDDAGFTPIDALVSATIVGAEAIGIDGRCGTIEPGKQADLLLLDKNPVDDIYNINSVYLVIKAGRMYKN